MKTREKLFAGGRRKRATIPIVVKNEDGTTETVEIDVVALSMEARGRIMTDSMTPTGEDGEQALDLGKMMPDIVIACAMEVGTEEPIFTEGDRDTVAALDAGFLDPIFQKATALSGMSKSALDEAKGNSAVTTG